MRIALNNGSVHECARITLVGIANKVLCLARRLPCGVPFEPRREACTTATCESRYLDFFDNILGSHCFEHLFKCSIAVTGCVFVYNFRIYNSAVTKRDSSLLFKKKLIFIGNFNIVNGVFVTVYICDNFFGILGLNLDKTLFKLAAVINIDNRFKEAHSYTTGNGQR